MAKQPHGNIPFLCGESDPAIHVTLPVRMAFDVLDDQVTSDGLPGGQSFDNDRTDSFLPYKNDVEISKYFRYCLFLDSSEQETTSESMFLYLQRIGAAPSDKPLVGQGKYFCWYPMGGIECSQIPECRLVLKEIFW